MAASQDSKGLTLTVLGSGTMGIAIMGGVMSSLADSKLKSSLNTDSSSKPSPNLSNFIACDTWPPAEEKVRSALSHYAFPLQTYTNNNLAGAQQADIVLLSCKPHIYKDILGEPGMRDALQGKVLVSILAGVSQEAIESFLYPEGVPEGGCRVVRVMPNTASFVRQSMSVIQTTSPPLAPHQQELVEFIFNSIGRTTTLPPSLMDVSTALCGSGPAFFALILEAAADGAVAMGMPRAEAQVMAAQTMRGTTGLVLEGGEHPAVLRDKVSTPGGTTIGGLLVLEEGGVRAAVSRAIREATCVAAALGEGVKNVNGTRR